MSTIAGSAAAVRPVATSARAAVVPQRFSKVLKSGLLLGAVTSVVLTGWILVGLGGAQYYRTPTAVRAYAPAHKLLRPSGPAGQTFGVVGMLLMTVPFVYAARKRIKRLKNIGSPMAWLEVHLFCGVVGPVLVTFHTAFKFNGVVSAAYWSMVLVFLSGFVGRFLYTRIPRTLRGVELSRTEMESRADDLRETLARVIQVEPLRRRIETFERAVQPGAPSFLDVLFGEFAVGWRVRALDRELGRADLPRELHTEVVAVAVERAMLLRRTAYLQKTKRLFALWHVFHMPLVYLMLIIVAGHVGVALYLGYVPFRW